MIHVVYNYMLLFAYHLQMLGMLSNEYISYVWSAYLLLKHREISPVTQTTPDPTLSSWGGWPREKSPPPRHPWTHGKPGLIVLNRATQTLLFSKPFDLVQVCHGNKICSKPALTWKLTLVLAFPAHCISNWKLNGISRTNINKVTSNAANERPLPFRCATDPLLGQKVGEKCAVEHESVVRKSPSGWSPYAPYISTWYVSNFDSIILRY